MKGPSLNIFNVKIILFVSSNWFLYHYWSRGWGCPVWVFDLISHLKCLRRPSIVPWILYRWKDTGKHIEQFFSLFLSFSRCQWIIKVFFQWNNLFFFCRKIPPFNLIFQPHFWIDITIAIIVLHPNVKYRWKENSFSLSKCYYNLKLVGSFGCSDRNFMFQNFMPYPVYEQRLRLLDMID